MSKHDQSYVEAMIVIGATVGLAVTLLLFIAWLLQWAWNTFAPVFNVSSLDYPQAIAATILLGIVSSVIGSRNGK